MATLQLSNVEELRGAIAAYLPVCPAQFDGTTIGAIFSPPISVLTQSEGDIVSAIQDQIAKVGIGLEIYVKSFGVKQDQTYGVQLNPVIIGVAICEDVLINRDPSTGTGRTAFYLLEALLAALKMYVPEGFYAGLMPDENGFKFGKSDKVSPTTTILIQEFSTIIQLEPRLA